MYILYIIINPYKVYQFHAQNLWWFMNEREWVNVLKLFGLFVVCFCGILVWSIYIYIYISIQTIYKMDTGTNTYVNIRIEIEIERENRILFGCSIVRFILYYLNYFPLKLFSFYVTKNHIFINTCIAYFYRNSIWYFAIKCIVTLQNYHVRCTAITNVCYTKFVKINRFLCNYLIRKQMKEM